MFNFGSRDLGAFVGTFRGDARWIDITGESKNYRVEFETSLLEGALRVAYTHDFYEEGNVTSGDITLRPVTGPLLDSIMAGNVVGHGYVFGNILQYHLAVGGIFIEVTYERTANGLTIRGSSSSNKQGRYIAWLESLATAL
jgi:hypothetical protein